MASDWPMHADGRLKKIGEMTADERRAVFQRSIKDVCERFERQPLRDGDRLITVTSIQDPSTRH